MITKRIRNIGIYFYMLFTISSCYLIPCNLDSGLNELKEKQNDDFFIGEYIVEKSFNTFETDRITIKLEKSGVIEMNNIPSEILHCGKGNQEINIMGTWKQNFIKSRQKDRYFLPTDLEFDPKYEGKCGLRTIQIYVKEKKPVLFIDYGDPDECRAIRFIKK